MSKLNARKRARLRGSAFAYVDSRGRRRLPIHDKAHVRNALARFGQVGFEDDAPREREQRLRSVLRDPTLAVLHWSDAAGAYLDGTGKPAALPAEGGGRVVT